MSRRHLTALLRAWSVPTLLTNACLIALIGKFAPPVISLPSLVAQASVTTPRSTFICLLDALLLTLTLSEPISGSFSLTTSRSVRQARATRFVVLALVLLAFALAARTTTVAATTNTFLVLVGEVCLSYRLFGRGHGWFLPCSHLLAAVTFGVSGPGSVATWARLIHAQPGVADIVVAGLVALAGLGIAAHTLG